MKKKLSRIGRGALLVAILCSYGCDVDSAYKNGGGIIRATSGENPSVKTVRIDGCDYLAFQTAYGYWNYTLKGNGNCATTRSN